jgi:hypothetical protein
VIAAHTPHGLPTRDGRKLLFRDHRRNRSNVTDPQVRNHADAPVDGYRLRFIMPFSDKSCSHRSILPIPSSYRKVDFSVKARGHAEAWMVRDLVKDLNAASPHDDRKSTEERFRAKDRQCSEDPLENHKVSQRRPGKSPV